MRESELDEATVAAVVAAALASLRVTSERRRPDPPASGGPWRFSGRWWADRQATARASAPRGVADGGQPGWRAGGR